MVRPVKAERAIQQAAGELCITVLFTDLERTRLALRSGVKLAQNLNASFQIVVTRVVPYPLPLDKPPISRAFTEQQILELTRDLPVEPAVRIYDCRDAETTILQALPAASVVIAGFRRRWWSIRRIKLIRTLRNAGHEVILAD